MKYFKRKDAGCQVKLFDKLKKVVTYDKKKGIPITVKNFLIAVEYFEESFIPEIIAMALANSTNKYSNDIFDDGCNLNRDVFYARHDKTVLKQIRILACVFVLQAQGVL